MFQRFSLKLFDDTFSFASLAAMFSHCDAVCLLFWAVSLTLFASLCVFFGVLHGFALWFLGFCFFYPSLSACFGSRKSVPKRSPEATAYDTGGSGSLVDLKEALSFRVCVVMSLCFFCCVCCMFLLVYVVFVCFCFLFLLVVLAFLFVMLYADFESPQKENLGKTWED